MYFDRPELWHQVVRMQCPPPPTKLDVRLHGTTGRPESVEQAVGAVQGALGKE
jgi:hypothetical protein